MVYPASQTNAAIQTYAILDEQSNITRTVSEVFNVSEHPTPYSLKTSAGTIETEVRQARAFLMEPTDSSITLSLPPMIECNESPNNLPKIPTPEVDLSHAHLRHLAKHTPGSHFAFVRQRHNKSSQSAKTG